MAKRTPTDTDAAAPARNICGHLDRKGDVQRVCVRDPHDDAQHNMFPATAELARSLAARGVSGPGIDEFGMVDDGDYHEAPVDPYGVPDFHVHTDETTAITLEHVHPYDGPHEHPAPEDPDTLVVGNPAVLAALPPPEGDQVADPPAIPRESGDVLEPSSAAGSGGGSGRSQAASEVHTPDPTDGPVGVAAMVQRPTAEQGMGAGLEAAPSHTTGRSIGRVVANTAMDTALGVPADVLDERAHAREAAELLMEAAADHYRHNRLMPYARLLDLQAVVEHMVEARKVVR